MIDKPEMHSRYWMTARDKPGLLVAVMHALAGNAHISFHGDLSHCDLFSVPGASGAETECLRRCTMVPGQDFVVCPLEFGTIKQILSEVMPDGRAVHQIIHIQIEKDGQFAFGAYDNFRPRCITIGHNLPESRLKQFKDRGLLRSVYLAPA